MQIMLRKYHKRRSSKLHYRRIRGYVSITKLISNMWIIEKKCKLSDKKY